MMVLEAKNDMKNYYTDFINSDPDLWLMRWLWERKFDRDTILHCIDFCGEGKEVCKEKRGDLLELLNETLI